LQKRSWTMACEAVKEEKADCRCLVPVVPGRNGNLNLCNPSCFRAM
jgi:hypothetical protein